MSGASRTAAIALVRTEEGEGGHEAAHTFLGLPFVAWQAINLVLFLFFLYKLLSKPLAKWLAERQSGVARELKESEEKRARTEALAKELSQRLARIEGELAELRSHSEKGAVEEQAALVAQTEEDAKRIVQRASAEIDSRVRAARQELTAYAGDLAVELATDLVKKNLTPDDQERLVREGIDALGRERG